MIPWLDLGCFPTQKKNFPHQPKTTSRTQTRSTAKKKREKDGSAKPSCRYNRETEKERSKWWFSKGNGTSYFKKKSRFVKDYNLARIIGSIGFDIWLIGVDGLVWCFFLVLFCVSWGCFSLKMWSWICVIFFCCLDWWEVWNEKLENNWDNNDYVYFGSTLFVVLFVGLKLVARSLLSRPLGLQVQM